MASTPLPYQLVWQKARESIRANIRAHLGLYMGAGPEHRLEELIYQLTRLQVMCMVELLDSLVEISLEEQIKLVTDNPVAYAARASVIDQIAFWALGLSESIDEWDSLSFINRDLKANRQHDLSKRKYRVMIVTEAMGPHSNAAPKIQDSPGEPTLEELMDAIRKLVNSTEPNDQELTNPANSAEPNYQEKKADD